MTLGGHNGVITGEVSDEQLEEVDGERERVDGERERVDEDGDVVKGTYEEEESPKEKAGEIRESSRLSHPEKMSFVNSLSLSLNNANPCCS